MKINFKLFKNLKNSNFLRYIYEFIGIVALFIFIILGYFLYQNIYQSIVGAEEVILRKKEVAPEALDMTKIRQTIIMLDQKATTTQNINIDQIRDPFANKNQIKPTSTSTPIK